MDKKLIFVVDDDPHIRELLNYNLIENGYMVSSFESGIDMFVSIINSLPDLILLDLMMPGMDGIVVCRRLREDKATKTIPVIFLTAKNEEFDKVLGLELGADDYITKPFSIRELLARVKALLRRANIHCEPDSEKNSSKNQDICIQDICLNEETREVTKGGEILQLTLKEFELLKILIVNHGRVLSRENLLNKIWGYDYFGETRTVDVHIRNLRKILGDDEEKYIETIRGIGYKFKL